MTWFKRFKSKSGSIWTISTGGITRSTGSSKGRQRSTRSFSTARGFTRTTTLKIGGWTKRRKRAGFFDPTGWLMSAGCDVADSMISPAKQSRNYSSNIRNKSLELSDSIDLLEAAKKLKAIEIAEKRAAMTPDERVLFDFSAAKAEKKKQSTRAIIQFIVLFGLIIVITLLFH